MHWLVVLWILSSFREAHAGYCTEAYSCAQTCQREDKYYASCGLFGWNRCTRYRTTYYSCTGTCYRQVCCAGYTGSGCETPICFGSTACKNGGTCLSPDSCKCPTGYATPQCNDFNECTSGTHGCQQNCVNTAGSFYCTCNSGYTLNGDRKTCRDVDECQTNNGGCAHTCRNSVGSFRCDCNVGYELQSDGKSCLDINECTRRTSGCKQICTNTQGSFTCSCQTGYTISIDGKSCEDVDECTSGASKCVDYCMNTPGSYSCYCGQGFVIGSDGFTCEDINECSKNNGNCSQICKNLPGTHECQCFTGYRMEGAVCNDINECEESSSGCAQTCHNSEGSYTCSCRVGYQLASDGKMCTDIDDCEEVSCVNDGTCMDGVNKYTCICMPGFTGSLCETDVDECQTLNGGCQDVCINIEGSFYCNCSEGRQLQSDGFTCDIQEDLTVFERNLIPRKLLPKVCFTVLLAKCKDGNTLEIYLSSTSPWYSLITDSDVIYTLGIVYVKLNNFSVPVSLRGLEVILGDTDFTINYGVQYGSEQGTYVTNTLSSPNCSQFELVEGDLFEFINADSFMKTLLFSLFPSLPNWIKFDKKSDEILAIQDLRSDLVYGQNMDDITYCSGAPVFPEHLYTVFQFGTGFTLRVLGQDVSLPRPLMGRNFCLIVDLCQSYGGTVFLMIPEGSRDLLLSIDLFRNLKDEQNLQILPRGIGISLTDGINTKSHTLSLKLWNGDTMFTPLLPNVDLWIGADVIKYDKFFTVAGAADIYMGVPRVQTMLTSMFLEEWTGLVDIRAAQTSIRFPLFGKEYEIPFTFLTGAVSAYLSLGGSGREWCGEFANPSGLYGSALVDASLFKGIPVLDKWTFITTQVYVFISNDVDASRVNISSISFRQDILNVDSVLRDFLNIARSTLQSEETEVVNTAKELVIQLEDILEATSEIIDSSFNEPFLKNVKIILEQLNRIREKFLRLEQILIEFADQTEFIANNAIINITDSFHFHLDVIRGNIHRAISSLTRNITSSVGNYTGFGIKGSLDLDLFGLNLPGFDVEIVYSEGNLLKCSRFDKVRELLSGETALRSICRAYKPIKLNFFLRYKVGGGAGFALSAETNKIILQLEAYVSMIGIRATADLFITQKGLYFYLEGNVWDIFLAQIDVSAEVGKKWYHLIFTLQGRFVAKAKRKRSVSQYKSKENSYLQAFKEAKKLRKASVSNTHWTGFYNLRRKRQIQTVSTSFQASYLDALKKVIRLIGDETQKRLTEAQNAITKAQSGLTIAQNWLDEKKKDVRKANVYFDNAVAGLERAKETLEQAKEPFYEAVRKLEAAQRKIDNLCQIRTCSKICIPGIECRICYKRVWGIKIPYPCCRFTSCMISFPDPICVLANIACRIIRALAYAILEAAKIFVRVAMLAFDIAQAALSVAQFVVDKSRIVLTIAEGVLDLANTGLELAKGVLEAAKIALEAVKFVVGVAVNVLELIIEYGLKSIIDVRNCGFSIELSTVDLPVFEVFCDVNPFRLGWTTVNIKINFKNLLQSLWEAARATVNVFMDLLGALFSGRRKRELSFEATSKMHVLLRKIREVGISNDTDVHWNETVDIAQNIIGFSKDNNSEYDSRIEIFEAKCLNLLKVQSFMQDAFQSIGDVLNESKSYLKEADYVKEQLQMYSNSERVSNNITIEDAGISREYAAKDYNMTEGDLDKTINDTQVAAEDDPLMIEIKSAANVSLESVESETNSVESIDYLNVWFASMHNMTAEYFNKSECEGFKDCVFYSISTLYMVYEYEDSENISKIQTSILALEDILIQTFQNESTTILGAADVMEYVTDKINILVEVNIFCSEPPKLVVHPQNITVLIGGNATFICNATGDPAPKYQWYKDNTKVSNKTDNYFLVTNVTEGDNNTSFFCVAENVVASITSSVAYLFVLETDTDECLKNNGNCEQICDNTVGSFMCACIEGFRLSADGQSCEDVNECSVSNGACSQLCQNENGTFSCLCTKGFTLLEDGKTCKDVDECSTGTNDCAHECVNEEGSFSCLCREGYRLDADNVSCSDINECDISNHTCEHTCMNEAGTYSCRCSDGYILANDSFSCIDIDECQTDNADCPQICVNEQGSYSCQCKGGFNLLDDRKTCEDVNECVTNNGGCGHICINEEGSFICQCNEGFTLQADGIMCVDVDECQEKNLKCSQSCINTEGSFSCQCNDGYQLQNDGFSCVDIDECTTGNNGCSHKCINEEGSFRCDCNDGYMLQEDGVSCLDADECITDNGGCLHICKNTEGSFECQCKVGFLLQNDGVSCIDIDECQTDNGACSQMCINEIGSFKCNCKNGYKLQNDNFSCSDINECKIDNGGCSHKCTNAEGTFKCQCNDGYILQDDEMSCVDTDECQIDNGGCSHTCVNEIGSFKCRCNDGYILQDDGFSCENVDECKADISGCSQMCIDAEGSFKCQCSDGYTLQEDGVSCIDIDECQRENGGCAHICINKVGSYNCHCKDGFFLQEDGFLCGDIDECQTGNGGCADLCSNEEGSFRCSCNNGYTLKEDGLSCVDTDECLTNNGGCQHWCKNRDGSFDCQCQKGYILEENGFNCTDIDECGTGINECSHDCINVEGSFTCLCSFGHRLQDDGHSCTDIDECEENNGGCLHLCVNEVGGFHCECKAGYVIQDDGVSCADINECTQNNVGCAHLCINVDGGYECQCNNGYSLHEDGFSCIDVNECSQNNGGCSQVCINIGGSYLCKCTDGFRLENDNKSCVDINECEDFRDTCDLLCINYNGTYSCACPAGFLLEDDVRSCKRLEERSLASVVRLDVGDSVTRESLLDFAEYKRIETLVAQALTLHIHKYTSVEFRVIINSLRIGSLYAEYTIVLKNATEDLAAIDTIIEAAMDLAGDKTLLFDGRPVTANTVLPDNVTEPCEVLAVLSGGCRSGFRCEEVGGHATCRSFHDDEQVTTGNYIVYIAPAAGVAGLFVLILGIVFCGKLIRQSKEVDRSGKYRTNSHENEPSYLPPSLTRETLVWRTDKFRNAHSEDGDKSGRDEDPVHRIL